jgi:hypothetical protein
LWRQQGFDGEGRNNGDSRRHLIAVGAANMSQHSPTCGIFELHLRGEPIGHALDGDRNLPGQGARSRFPVTFDSGSNAIVKLGC